MGVNNVVFAANKTHALAMIQWLRLDSTLWHANEYGGNMRKDYDRAILVRPVDGVTQEHFLWVTQVLAPRMRSTDNITVLHWRYADFPSSATLGEQIAYTTQEFSWT
jgi:hypothetical protein